MPHGRRNQRLSVPCRKKPEALQNAHMLCYAATRTAQCISIRVTFRLYASRFGFLRALHLNICVPFRVFEQPPNMGAFNATYDSYCLTSNQTITIY
jgi:hypothetical protein